MTTVELLLELFCAVTSLLKIGIYLVSLFQVISDGFIDLRQGKRRKVLANFFRRRAFPEGMDHAVKGHTTAGDTPGSLWGTDQKSGRSRSGFMEAILDQGILKGKSSVLRLSPPPSHTRSFRRFENSEDVEVPCWRCHNKTRITVIFTFQEFPKRGSSGRNGDKQVLSWAMLLTR